MQARRGRRSRRARRICASMTWFSESVSILTQLCTSVTTQGPFLLSLPNVVHWRRTFTRLGGAICSTRRRPASGRHVYTHARARRCASSRSWKTRNAAATRGPGWWIRPGTASLRSRWLTSGTRLRLLVPSCRTPTRTPSETEAKCARSWTPSGLNRAGQQRAAVRTVADLCAAQSVRGLRCASTTVAPQLLDGTNVSTPLSGRFHRSERVESSRSG